MVYSIFYFDEVEIDIKEARSWYKATNEKLENALWMLLKIQL
jgi:hypothetical protein